MNQAEADSFQQWAELEGHMAYHLIERHADNWDDINRMMNAWLKARSAIAIRAAEKIATERERERAARVCEDNWTLGDAKCAAAIRRGE